MFTVILLCVTTLRKVLGSMKLPTSLVQGPIPCVQSDRSVEGHFPTSTDDTYNEQSRAPTLSNPELNLWRILYVTFPVLT
jgi:hypothetical protein